MASDPTSVLEEMGSGLSKRASIWVFVLKQVGLPTAFLGIVLYGCSIVYKDIAKPVAATHISTLDTLAESSKSTAKSFEKLAAAHEDTVSEARQQKEELRGIRSEQGEIKQILKEGLKIQKTASAESHEKPHAGPPGGTDCPSQEPPGIE